MTFPTFPERFQVKSGNVTFPDNVSKKPTYGGTWKGLETSWSAEGSRTFPDGRPIQAGPNGGGLACLEGVVSWRGNLEP